jgi:hypothetical protein
VESPCLLSGRAMRKTNEKTKKILGSMPGRLLKIFP